MTEITEDELAEIRRRKLAELQRAQEEQIQQQQQEEMAKAQIAAIMKNLLTRDAWDQWNSAKTSNERNANTAAIHLIQLVNSGQIKGKINKEQLKAALSAVLRQTAKEFKITRK